MKTKKYFSTLAISAFLISATAGLSQASLLIADPADYPLLGIGDKESRTDHHQDTLANVDTLLDNYYQTDIATAELGKIEDMDHPGLDFGTLSFTVEDIGLTMGTATVTLDDEAASAWHAPLYFSVKAGTSFALYDAELEMLLPGSSFTFDWDTGALLSDNALSHISFWSDTTDTPAPVPEPATMLLFGSGMVGITGIARSRSRRKKENLIQN